MRVNSSGLGPPWGTTKYLEVPCGAGLTSLNAGEPLKGWGSSGTFYIGYTGNKQLNVVSISNFLWLYEIPSRIELNKYVDTNGGFRS